MAGVFDLQERDSCVWGVSCGVDETSGAIKPSIQGNMILFMIVLDHAPSGVVEAVGGSAVDSVFCSVVDALGIGPSNLSSPGLSWCTKSDSWYCIGRACICEYAVKPTQTSSSNSRDLMNTSVKLDDCGPI